MTVTFEDFKKLDIRIGNILSAEKIEGTDKLLKLEVDFAEFKRQIVSGIAKFYPPEELVGKQCPFILNLEPRMFMGIESQGMILAADENGEPVLLSPDKRVAVGSMVK